jgi:curli production assembly/transport component CsgF
MKKAITIPYPALPAWLAAIVLGCTVCATAGASPLTYFPVNPTFGGNPLNGPFLLNSAQAQNKYDENPDMSPGGSGFEPRTALQDFNETLQRSILGRLSAAATSYLIDASGNLFPGSTISSSDFIITISNPSSSGVLTITTTDKSTGAVTSFEVQQ